MSKISRDNKKAGKKKTAKAEATAASPTPKASKACCNCCQYHDNHPSFCRKTSSFIAKKHEACATFKACD